MASDSARMDTDDTFVSTAVVNDAPPSLSELPFLVTHWLEHYRDPGSEGDLQREEAIERLRNATFEIAAAFSSLGAYGTSTRVSFFLSAVACMSDYRMA